jgi:hypothetical protein
VKPAKSVESAAVETSAAAMEPTTAVETSAAAVETATTAMETFASAMGVGRIWLAERGNAQQSHGSGRQGPSNPRPGSMSA